MLWTSLTSQSNTVPAVETERPDSVSLLALLDHDGFGVVIAGVVSTGHLLYHVVSDSPQSQGAVPGARHQKLIVQPGLNQTDIVIHSRDPL